MLELKVKFDNFLAQHINTYANKGKGHKSYLSKTTYEEFIHIIPSSLQGRICEIKKCKYYSVSLNSAVNSPHTHSNNALCLTTWTSRKCCENFFDMEG